MVPIPPHQPNRLHISRPPAAEAEALAAMRIITAALGKARLLHLDFSDNALGEKGIRACAAAFVKQVGAGRHGGYMCTEEGRRGGGGGGGA